MEGRRSAATTKVRTHKCKKCGWEKHGKTAPVSCIKCKGTNFSFKMEKKKVDMTIQPLRTNYSDA